MWLSNLFTINSCLILVLCCTKSCSCDNGLQDFNLNNYCNYPTYPSTTFGFTGIKWHLVFLPHPTSLEAMGKSAPKSIAYSRWWLKVWPRFNQWLCPLWCLILCSFWLLICVSSQVVWTAQSISGWELPSIQHTYMNSLSARAVE